MDQNPSRFFVIQGDATRTEILARMEHARWYAERRLAGWTYAPPPKNVVHRTSPHLVPWDELDESIRQIDRDAVQAIALVMDNLADSCPAPDARNELARRPRFARECK